jgi:hypothetical protein
MLRAALKRFVSARPALALAALAGLLALVPGTWPCGRLVPAAFPGDPPATKKGGLPALGAYYTLDETAITFNAFSSRATRVEAFVYARPMGEPEKARLLLTRDAKTDVWSGRMTVAELQKQGIGKDV